VSPRIPTHGDLVTAVRAYAPSELLPALARLSYAQLAGRDDPALPRPWIGAMLARECIAYSNEYRGGRVTATAMSRLGRLGLNLADPVVTDTSAGAIDSMTVRYVYQQGPFTTFQPFGELARLIAVCDHTDAQYAELGLEVIREQTWVELLGMPLKVFARAAFAIMALARRSDGQFDPAMLANPDLARLGVTTEQALHVFHQLLARELADLRPLCAADRASDPAMRRLDFNPLVATPFVGLGGGRYLAPSAHLVEQRLGLAAIYYLGITKYRTKFARDLGKLVEAYVGRQLAQLDHDALVAERPYGKPGKGGMTCDRVLSLGGATIIVEAKAARIRREGQLGFTAYIDAVKRDVGDSLAKQVPVTVDLIRSGDAVFADIDLPTDIHAIVVTAEPFPMVNSEFYRGQLTEPGCPYTVLSLGELEWFVATVLAGVDGSNLIRALTSATARAESVMAEAAARKGVDPGSLRSRVAAGHGGDEVVGAAVGASGGAGDVGFPVCVVESD
jgi:hypothetical protein